MNYCENIKCKRINSCDYPCEPYTDYIINLSLNKNNIIQDKQNKLLPICNDIADFLEYGVESLEWLMVLNNKVPYTTLFNESSIFDYLNSESEKYCDQEGICHECRSSLKEFIDYEDGRIVERYLACPNGC